MKLCRIKLGVLILFVCSLLIIIPSGGAQEILPGDPTDDQVNVIARQLYCPVCENVPLDVCGTQACAQWRDLIRQRLAEGWSEQQIKDYFVAQYGDRVLATPPARGLNWLVYVVPPLSILIGLVILYRAFRSWGQKNPKQEMETSSLPSDDPYVSRIEEELTKR